MLRKSIFVSLTLGVTVLWAAPIHAQGCGSPSFPCSVVGLGPGGELPVKDRVVRGTTGAIKKDTAIEVIKQTAMLVDMLLQALRGQIEGGTAGIFLESQAEQRIGEALTYGSGASELWPGTFTYDETYPHGDWLDADLEQRRRVLDTQQTMQFLLERRQEEFQADEGEIADAAAGVNGARGRNQLLTAQAKVDVLTLQQSRKEQQLLMTIGNMLSAQHSDQLNREVKREAQERAWITNFGEEPELREFQESGL